jgi:peptidoglycan/LPS O-acetylase OafA/YrhL
MTAIAGVVHNRPIAAASAQAHYRPELDGLRAIAVLAVLLFHYAPSIGAYGFAGVDAFFVLSGFLIGGVLLRSPTLDLPAFYAHRVRRIFPALVLTLLSVLVAGWFLLTADDYRALGWHALAGAAFLPNIALMAETGYFDLAAHWKPLLHLWSLGVEEQFYLVFPFLLAAGAKRYPPFAIGLTITAGSLAWMGVAAMLASPSSTSSSLFFSPISRFWELSLGVALVSAETAEDARQLRRLTLMGLAGLLVWSVAGGHLPGSVAAAWSVAITLFAVSWLLCSSGSVVHRALALPAPVYLGRISYPLYLWHWPVLVLGGFLAANLDVRPSPWVTSTLAAVVSVALASATYHLLERRVRYHPSPIVVPALAAAMVAVGFLGAAIYLSNGVPARAASRIDLEEQTRWAWWDNDRCPAHIELDEPCLSSGDRPDILLLGDSHANDLFPGVAEIAAAGALHVGTEFRAPLRPFAQSFLVPGNDIRTVVLAQFWENKGWDEPALEQTIRTGLAAGKRVVLVLDTPNLGTPGLVRLTNYCRGSNCSIDRQELLAKQESFRAAATRLKARHPGLIILDPLEALCEGATCWIEHNGELRLRDDNHLSLAGSRRVAGRLLAD